MKLDVSFTPRDYPGSFVAADHAAAVIDVFRATSSIVTAMAGGSSRFLPVETIEEATERRRLLPDALLAGERQALPIPGFDFGNSPAEYTAARVGGRTIIMTTTNGTVALRRAAAARPVLVAAFINAGAVARQLTALGRDAVLLCAGTRGQFSLEDMLCAGAIVNRLDDACLSDTALAARAAYRDFAGDIVARVLPSSHATHLVRSGFAADITYCLTEDIYDFAPVYDGEYITLP